ncbi:MAG: hypothetical protein JXL84_03190 [Deltaproteobacteria bacterium]|nr:hypothetical protein [Deltaproteobacteria bacterium]
MIRIPRNPVSFARFLVWAWGTIAGLALGPAMVAADQKTPFANAMSYLDIPTVDGSGQQTHPAVQYFPEGWKGYRYWMAMTPYKDSREALENPSVVASNDNMRWEVPRGSSNPLVPREAVGHNCDPDLLFHPRTKQLWLTYIYSNDRSASFLNCLKSSDGVHWSETDLLFSARPVYSLLSQSLLYSPSDDKFCMWYVNAGNKGWNGQDNTIEFRLSSDGIRWSAPERVRFVQPGYLPWHIQVTYVGSKKEYWMIAACYPAGKNCFSCTLFFAKSKDRLNWVTYGRPILNAGRHGSWDGGNLYRSALLHDSGNNRIRMWYSASRTATRKAEWHIGYTERNYDEFIRVLKGII